ncbi:hypothetical protein AeMF1_019343 [Aphanomyces euteiches]|nr:hypothetical protein AeMF1_019343 [Aphanomyces euteiches]KAH9192150.1 hypothetical protein AeNC1_005874 [Aphanomyces euteiches]
MGGKFSQVYYREKDTALVRDFELLVQSWGKAEILHVSTQLRQVSFNFCLTLANFEEILELQHNSLFRPMIQRWFNLLKNTETSSVINGLEFIAALAVTGHTGKLIERISFIFDLFDFDNTGCLTKDELMILLKSTVRGLSKATVGLGFQLAKLCPMAQIEDLAAVCFRHCGLDATDDLRKDAFIQWVVATPKLTSILKCYVPKDRLSPDEAAAAIQRVARGMLGRNFVDELRLHKRLLQDQELDIAASKIQEAMIHRKKRQETVRRSKLERNAAHGAVYTFGANAHGLLGHEFQDLDQPMKKPKRSVYFQNSDQRVVGIAVGIVHAGAVTAAGVAYTWGGCLPGAFGTVEKGGELVRQCPKRVDDLTDVPISSMALGARHTMALSSDGHVYSWGSGEFGQLGHGDFTMATDLFQRQFDQHTSRSYPVVDLPLRLDKSLFGDVKIREIACGYYFSVAVADDGCVFTWGEGSDGQLGLGLTDDFCVGFLDDYLLHSSFTYMHTPQYVHVEEPIGHIAVGGNHVFAVNRNHRSVYEWGASFRRDGDAVYTPTRNVPLSNLYVKRIAAGKDYALAITGCVYLKLSGLETMYGVTAKFGCQPVDLYAGVSAPLIAAGVPKDKQAYAVKEEWTQKVVYVDRGKPTGVWLTIQGDDPFTLACLPSAFGPEFSRQVAFTGECFYTPQKLVSLKHYVRPEQVEGKLVVFHVEESDLPVHDADDDVPVVVERLIVAMVDKVRDAQECGALGVIIVFEFMADAFSLTTDSSFEFTIPSVMLNAAAGARLLNYITDKKRSGLPIKLSVYHHEDTLGDQLLAIQKSGATAIVVGQNDISKSPTRLGDTVFEGLGNRTGIANQMRIPVVMVSNETGSTIKAHYQRLIQDAFAEIGIASFGDVYAWGAGDHGVLGLGDMDNESIFTAGYDSATNTTYPVVKAPELIESLVQTRVVAISCGDHHAAAVSDTGDLFTWGSGVHGKLGHNSDQDEVIPRLVSALHAVNVIDVACGPQCTFAVTALGDSSKT